ncbi:hypothetical protein [Streptomyces sp. NPDC006856]
MRRSRGPSAAHEDGDDDGVAVDAGPGPRRTPDLPADVTGCC